MTYQPDEAPYLAEIERAPTDGGAWSAYAQHLLARSDPRGEFLSLTLARETDPSRRGRAEKTARLRSLEAAVEREWRDAFRAVMHPEQALHLTRGVATGVCVDSDRLASRDSPLFLSFPWTRRVHLHLSGNGGALHGATTAHEDLRAVRALSLATDGTAPVASFFASKPSLVVLEELRAPGEQVNAADPTVLGKAHLPALKRLSLSGRAHQPSTRLDDEFIDRLVRAPFAAQLEELILSHAALGPEAARVLAASKALQRLEVLDLRGTKIGIDGALAIARSQQLVKLRVLRIDANALGGHCLAAFAGPLAFPLERLTTSMRGLSPLAAAKIAASERLTRLVRLELDDHELFADPEDLTTLRELPAALWPRRLTLRGTPGRAADVAPLADTAGFRALEELSLEGAALASVAKVLRAPPPRLEVLNVKRWVVRAPRPGAPPDPLLSGEFADVRGSLKELALAAGPLRDGDLEGLAAAPWLSGLKALELAHCSGPTASAWQKLVASAALGGLDHLVLTGVDLEDSGAAAIADNPVLDHLKTLDLQRAGLTEAGARRLGRARRSLERLDLRGLVGGDWSVEGRAELERLLGARVLLDPPKISTKRTSRPRDQLDVTGLDREVVALLLAAQAAADAARHDRCGLTHLTLQVLELPACARACKAAAIDRAVLVRAQAADLTAAVISREPSCLDPALLAFVKSLQERPTRDLRELLRALAQTGRLPAELVVAWPKHSPVYPLMSTAIREFAALARSAGNVRAGAAEHELDRFANLLRSEWVGDLHVERADRTLELRRENRDGLISVRIRGETLVLRGRSGAQSAAIKLDEVFAHDATANQFVDEARALSFSTRVCQLLLETLYPELARGGAG